MRGHNQAMAQLLLEQQPTVNAFVGIVDHQGPGAENQHLAATLHGTSERKDL